MSHSIELFRQTVIMDAAEMRAIHTWKSYLFGWLARLLTQAAFFAAVGRYVGDEATMRYVLVGNLVVLVCLECTIVVVAMAGERRTGTLPLLVTAPSSHLPVYLGRGLHWLASGLASALVGWLLLPPLLKVPLPWPQAAYAIPVIVLVGLSSYCYGCLLAALALRRPGGQWLVLNLGYLLIMAFGGVNVPTSFWPVWVRVLGELFPVTHGLAAVRGLLAGAPEAEVLRQVGLEALVGAGWLLLAVLAVDWLVGRGRRDGSLEFGA